MEMSLGRSMDYDSSCFSWVAKSAQMFCCILYPVLILSLHTVLNHFTERGA